MAITDTYDPKQDQVNAFAHFDGAEHWRDSAIGAAESLTFNLKEAPAADMPPEVFYWISGQIGRLQMILSKNDPTNLPIPKDVVERYREGLRRRDEEEQEAFELRMEQLREGRGND